MDNAKNSQINIDLSAKKKPYFANTFFAWAITIGKTIIVLTELVALSALFYRFIIDRQIVDLHDQIKTAATLVKLQEKQENEYRDIQERLKTIKNLSNQAGNKIQLLNNLLQDVQKNQIATNKLGLDQNSVNLAGISPSVFNLVNFINNLRSEPNISSISVDKINSLPQGVNFQIVVSIK